MSKVGTEPQCDRFAGVLLGTAIGDALGLPAENLSPDKIRRLWGGEWRMRLVFGRGMISDDSEHTLLVAQALLAHPGNVDAFRRSLAWKLRWWFAGLPAGVGFATAKACLRLWLGFPPNRSGVASGGSGSAMRSAIIGAYFAEDATRRAEFVKASSRITHRSWQAETAALAVAECATIATRASGQADPAKVFTALRELSGEKEWQDTLAQMETCLSDGASVAEFAQSMGLSKGVTGYSLHVVPIAIYAWLRHPNDFRSALTETLNCGGDTDTTGAIVGAAIGQQSLPTEWATRIWEWPRSTGFIRRIARRLAEQSGKKQALGAVRYVWPAVIPRNLFFLAIVLAHGFRRLLPF